MLTTFPCLQRKTTCCQLSCSDGLKSLATILYYIMIDYGSTLMPLMKVIESATGPIIGRIEIALEKEPKSLG